MNIYKLNEIFSTDFNIYNIFSINKKWSGNAQSNYFKYERKFSSIFMLTSHTSTFTLADGSEFTLKPGEIMLLPKLGKYIVRHNVPDGEMTIPLMVSFDISDTSGNEILFGENPIKLIDNCLDFQSIFKEITEFYKDNNIIKLKEKTYELLSKIFPIYDKDECMVNYINNHISANLSIAELSKRCNMSETAYRKRFKEITGMSPIKYITKSKIEKACHMLIYGDISPDDISSYLNFGSSPYFYRVFKEYMNMTPKEYKKMMYKSL